MKRARLLLAGLTLTLVTLLGAACANNGTETPQGGNNVANTGNLAGLGSFSSAELASFAGSLFPSIVQSAGYQQAGIWVTGIGRVTLEPDLALLSLGVETRAGTVSEAREQAATAMTAIIAALKARGIADNDIKTQYFNIYPEYTYQEVFENGGRYGKQVLTGYRVSNTVSVKIRNLDIVGPTIDDVVEAGGDATRINNVQFMVEDASSAQALAREKAVLDAIAKANQFATLTGETRGSLLYIAESGSYAPVYTDYARLEGVAAADSISTPINPGELEIQVSVQAVFAIGN